MMFQISGRKLFRLFAPIFDEALYPITETAPTAGVYSQVDIDAPDLVRFPRFRSAVQIDVVLEPGDALFLPVYWWHDVVCMGLSVSVNRWWPAPFHLWLRPNHEEEEGRDKWLFHLANSADLSLTGFSDLLDMAEWLHRHAYLKAAGWIVDAYVQNMVSSLLGGPPSVAKGAARARVLAGMIARLRRNRKLTSDESRFLQRMTAGARGSRPLQHTNQFVARMNRLRSMAKSHSLDGMTIETYDLVEERMKGWDRLQAQLQKGASRARRRTPRRPLS